MTPQASQLQTPRTTDAPLYDLLYAPVALSTICVAYQKKLFEWLDEGPRSLREIATKLDVELRPAEMMLNVCTSKGLLEREGDKYRLTPLAEDYLLPRSPTYFGGFLDLSINNGEVYAFPSVKKAIETNQPQAYAGKEVWTSHEQQAELARGFTHAMHGHSMAAGLHWPSKLDLSSHRTMLDIAGGSGAHSIGAVARWQELKSIVLDMAPVCEVAAEYVAQHGFTDRISTSTVDMWKDPFPTADLHFYSNIYHDWEPEKGRFLTKKSFDSLPSGGRLIVHEMLLDTDKNGPGTVAGFSMVMLLWTQGQQYSGAELEQMFSDAGFVNVETIPTFGYWGIVTGRKP